MSEEWYKNLKILWLQAKKEEEVRTRSTGEFARDIGRAVGQGLALVLVMSSRLLPEPCMQNL